MPILQVGLGRSVLNAGQGRAAFVRAHLAAHFTRASSQRLTIAHNATLDTSAGNGFTVCSWGKQDTLASFEYLMHMGAGGAMLGVYCDVSGILVGFINNGGGAVTSTHAVAGSVPYFWCFRYDRTANLLKFRVNANADDTSAYSTNKTNDSNGLSISGKQDGTNCYNGIQDSMGFFANRCYSDQDVTDCYNAGAGYEWGDLPAGLRTGNTYWIDGNEGDGQPRLDSGPNGNTFTDVNTATRVASFI